jgi:RND family efflux transporter MFP subunit
MNLKFFAIVLVILLFFGAVSCSKEQETDNSNKNSNTEIEHKAKNENMEVPVIVNVATVKKGDLVKNIKTQGMAVCRRKQKFEAKVEGKILSGIFENGKRVKKGRVILKIDDRKYKLAFAKAEASLSKALTNLIFYNIDENKGAKYKTALSALKESYKNGKISFDKYLEKSLNLRKKAVSSGDLQKEVAYASTGISDARYVLEQARIDLENCTITAPFDGIIANMEGFKGRYVYPGEHLFDFIDTNSIYVKASLMETELPFIAKGKRVELRFSAYKNKVFTGVIDEINPVIDEQERTVFVYIKINNKNKLIFDGMYADVTVDTVRIKNVMLVPVSAVVERGGRPLVFVVGKDLRAKWIYVKVVDKNDYVAAIISDSDYDSVKTGDKVVASNNFTLGHGSLLKVAEELDF